MIFGRTAVCLFCGGVVVPGSPCPQSFVCPVCGAKPGIPCHHPSGHIDMHPERRRRAEGPDTQETPLDAGELIAAYADDLTVDELAEQVISQLHPTSVPSWIGLSPQAEPMMGSVKVLAGAARAATAPGRDRTRRRPSARLDRPRPGARLVTTTSAAKLHPARSPVRTLTPSVRQPKAVPPAGAAWVHHRRGGRSQPQRSFASHNWRRPRFDPPDSPGRGGCVRLGGQHNRR